MTVMVRDGWYPGIPSKPLNEALAKALSDCDRAGVAEEARDIAYQNSEAIGNLVAALTERGLITPGKALEICGANYRYEIVDAPADGA